MAGPYQQCPVCGANNDPGEKCACNGIPTQLSFSKVQKKQHVIDKPANIKKLEPAIYTVYKNGIAYMYCTLKERNGSDA